MNVIQFHFKQTDKLQDAQAEKLTSKLTNCQTFATKGLLLEAALTAIWLPFPCWFESFCNSWKFNITENVVWCETKCLKILCFSMLLRGGEGVSPFLKITTSQFNDNTLVPGVEVWINARIFCFYTMAANLLASAKLLFSQSVDRHTITPCTICIYSL